MSEPKDVSARNKKYYESDVGLKNVSSWYNNQKEQSFVEFLFAGLCLPPTGLIVEIGGGAGIHGHMLAKRFGERYLFTDLSKTFVDTAAASGLRAIQMDGLALAFPDGSITCAFLVGTSTLLHDQKTRHLQFRECARIVRLNGTSIFVNSRWDHRYHSWDNSDLECLRDLGFSTVRLGWGMIPGSLWRTTNKGVFSLIEKLVSKTNLSGRTILLAQKK